MYKNEAEDKSKKSQGLSRRSLIMFI